MQQELENMLMEAPKQLSEGFAIGSAIEPTTLGEGIEEIVIAGMGGSALPGDLVRDTIMHERHLHVVRDYFIPKYLQGSHSLVICCSYSGNTEETISAIHSAHSKGSQVILVSHGGQIKELAEELHLPFLEVPEALQPRFSTGAFYGIVLGILQKLELIKPVNHYIHNTEKFLLAEMNEIKTHAQKLVPLIKDHTPLIYSGTHLATIARIFKINFNENTKIHAFFNVFPELNHNEMVGFQHTLFKPIVLMLRSQFDYERTHKRMDILESLLEEQQILVHEIELKGEHWLEESFYTLMLAYFTTTMLADAYGIDPVDTSFIESFKKRMI